jgi:hypothetical protein
LAQISLLSTRSQYRNSQVIIIENQHPPERIEEQVALTVFTGNPSAGRYGLL